MKIRIFYNRRLFVLCMGIFLWSPIQAFAQPMDTDLEERLSVEKPLLDVVKPEVLQDDSGLRENQEIKYIAGTDNKWFTKDDDVYEYFLLYYDDKGRLTRKSGFLEGADSLLMTKDDVLNNYTVYEFAADGNISRESLYDGKGTLRNTGIYAYDDAGQKSSIKRYDPENKEIGSMNFFHGHAGLIVQDVEYKDGQIEKYHRFFHDDKHRTGRVVEYLGSAGGKGADGVWLTDDDVVTSAKQCFYNKDGTKDKEKKYIQPGPDKKWFTKDDVLQYYTEFYYQKAPLKFQGGGKR